jgi:ABC-type uncharacterized transport system auxiliary subunit
MRKFPPIRGSSTPLAFRGPGLRSGLMLLLLLLLWGCGKPPLLIHQYLLEYPAPVVRASTPLDASLKVEKFAVAQAFNTTSMIYRPNPYTSAVYHYNRWRVNPGYLVTDYLVRDLRDSRFFKAVLSADNSSKGRFLLEGGVEEIQEIDEPGTWKAALALNVTLLDTSQTEITQRVLFQKNYQTQEPLREKTPAGLAQAMSRAMERLSARIIADVYQAIKKVCK